MLAVLLHARFSVVGFLLATILFSGHPYNRKYYRTSRLCNAFVIDRIGYRYVYLVTKAVHHAPAYSYETCSPWPGGVA